MAVLTSLPALVLAQRSWVGPRAGVNFSRLTDFTESALGAAGEQSWQPGFVAGVTAMVELDTHWVVQPEMHFVRKGWRVDLSAVDEGTLDGSLVNDFPSRAAAELDYVAERNDYLVVPLLLQYRFGGESIQGYLNAGPQLGYWVYSAAAVNDGNNTQSFGDPELEAFLDELIARYELGIAGGGGVLYPLTDHVQAFGEVRTSLGLNGPYNEDYILPGGEDAQNFSLSAAVGVLFKI